jgi:hypothetical protein
VISQNGGTVQQDRAHQARLAIPAEHLDQPGFFGLPAMPPDGADVAASTLLISHGAFE